MKVYNKNLRFYTCNKPGDYVLLEKGDNPICKLKIGQSILRYAWLRASKKTNHPQQIYLPSIRRRDSSTWTALAPDLFCEHTIQFNNLSSPGTCLSPIFALTNPPKTYPAYCPIDNPQTQSHQKKSGAPDNTIASSGGPWSLWQGIPWITKTPCLFGKKQ